MSQTVSDFKRKVQESTQVPAWGKSPAKAGTPAPASSSAGATPPPEGSKKKKGRTDIVYSQPKDTAAGSARGTQLAYALEHLKKHPGPMRLADLAVMSNAPLLLTDAALVQSLEADPNVTKNPNNDLYEWKRVYNSRTPEELFDEIKLRGRDGGGMSIKQLKEGFPDVLQHIEELEKQGKVLVTRAAKDNAPKFVFYNEITAEQGGRPVDEEFRTLWESLQNPVEADLLRALEREGLQATASEALPAKQPKKKSKKAKVSNRVHKITNTHIEGIDLTKDFVKPPTS